MLQLSESGATSAAPACSPSNRIGPNVHMHPKGDSDGRRVCTEIDLEWVLAEYAGL